VRKHTKNAHHTKAVLVAIKDLFSIQILVAMNCLENDYTPVTSFGIV
jgi:hypothetical protein